MEKGARMRFLKKLFGFASNLNRNDDYARATFEYATRPEIIERNTINYRNREFDFRYKLPVTSYTRVRQIDILAVKNVDVIGLQQPRISVTLYKSFTSGTYLSIGRG